MKQDDKGKLRIGNSTVNAVRKKKATDISPVGNSPMTS